MVMMMVIMIIIKIIIIVIIIIAICTHNKLILFLHTVTYLVKQHEKSL